MTDEGPSKNFSLLKEAVGLLARSADEQREWMKYSGQGIDEMRLQLLDVGSCLFPLYRENELIDSTDETAVTALELHLNSSLANDELFQNWKAVKNDTFWQETRKLARVAFTTLGRAASERVP
jgi:hypothetical protein